MVVVGKKGGVGGLLKLIAMIMRRSPNHDLKDKGLSGFFVVGCFENEYVRLWAVSLKTGQRLFYECIGKRIRPLVGCQSEDRPAALL